MKTFWNGKKRYNAYRHYMLDKKGERVQKISVDAHFTCPNRDGTKGYGGCIYCNNDGFTPGYLQGIDSIEEQIEIGIERIGRRYRAKKFIVYFQSYSNTYASLDHLKELYESALSYEEVIGLAIGTRPDCIDEEKLDYLEGLAQNYDITIEYGLESIHDETLEAINRQHSVDDFVNAVQMTAGRNIQIGTHLILGLPNETKEMMLAAAPFISKLPIDYLKLHHLQIVWNTILAKRYQKRPFPLFQPDEYVELVAEFLRRLNPDIVIQRIAGEIPSKYLIAPQWDLLVQEVIAMLDEYMETHEYYQGELY